jgi:hypothetical protein
MSEAAEYTIRFRHTLGDIGPFQFESTSSVQSVKEELFSRWPAEGPLSKESPTSAADLRILCSGQFLDNAKALKDLHKMMGNPEAQTVVTMHVLVRPPQLGKAAEKAEAESAKPAKSGCGCTIC